MGTLLPIIPCKTKPQTEHLSKGFLLFSYFLQYYPEFLKMFGSPVPVDIFFIGPPKILLLPAIGTNKNLIIASHSDHYKSYCHFFFHHSFLVFFYFIIYNSIFCVIMWCLTGQSYGSLTLIKTGRTPWMKINGIRVGHMKNKSNPGIHLQQQRKGTRLGNF